MMSAGCLLWTAAGLALLARVGTLDLPGIDAVVMTLGCTALALSFRVARFEFRRGEQRLHVAPDAGFHVLAAISVAPPLAAIVGGLGVLYATRDGRSVDRAFLACNGALATGIASIVAHDVAHGVPHGRDVVLAVLLAATTRALLVLAGRLLHAEWCASGGGLALLQLLPVRSILVLEAGLPVAVVAMAAPFLDAPPLALLVVLGGQLLTWWVLRTMHAHFRSDRITTELLDTFHRYVPRHVADRILETDGPGAPASTGGEQRDISVMFVDIRGFTSWSEKTVPSEVLAELNLLLGDLADSILATDGTVDKFTGDGLMAFWNAPADQPDHASRAVQALPRLLMRVREFNLRREAQRSQPLEIGIGIATGPAMVGNIGHRDRLAYTAIGDTVNLAARLEKATVEHELPALVDERTFMTLPAQLQRQFMRLESIEVKGRSERVRLYAPVALIRHRPPRSA